MADESDARFRATLYRAVRRPRPKCGHSPGHEAGACQPTLGSYWGTHLDEFVDQILAGY